MVLSIFNSISNTIYVELMPDSKRKLVTLKYSVDSIIDNRSFNSNVIGILGHGKRETSVLVKKGLTSSIKDYIQTSYTMDTPLESSYTMKVNLLKCSSRQSSLLMIAELEYEFEFIDNITHKIILVEKSTLNCRRLIIYGSVYELLIKRALDNFLNKINDVLYVPQPIDGCTVNYIKYKSPAKSGFFYNTKYVCLAL